MFGAGGLNLKRISHSLWCSYIREPTKCSSGKEKVTSDRDGKATLDGNSELIKFKGAQFY